MRLIARGLRYRYSEDAPWIVDGGDLQIETGERIALVGPSGSGKTTVLAIIGGLLTPDSGEVGVEITDEGVGADDATAGNPLRPSYDFVSWVLQTTNMLPDRDALHNASLGALAEGDSIEGARSRGRAALEAVGLASKETSLARTLSGGELQRVSIARALASSRPFILADEPTGQLDQRTTDAVLDVLFGQQHHRAVLVVTHDADVAARCQRVLAVREQRLVPHGVRP